MDAPGGATTSSRPWSSLRAGERLTVVKLSPDGSEAARYHANVADPPDADGWVVVRAIWTFRAVAVDELKFQPDDVLLEWFSPNHDFNAFAVFAPDGTFRGWYANVTLPAYLAATDDAAEPAVLVWHDLYLDLVGLPNGEFRIHDRDELDASPIRRQNPALFERIIAAGRELEARFTRRQTPFLAQGDMARFV